MKLWLALYFNVVEHPAFSYGFDKTPHSEWSHHYFHHILVEFRRPPRPFLGCPRACLLILRRWLAPLLRPRSHAHLQNPLISNDIWAKIVGEHVFGQDRRHTHIYLADLVLQITCWFFSECWKSSFQQKLFDIAKLRSFHIHNVCTQCLKTTFKISFWRAKWATLIFWKKPWQMLFCPLKILLNSSRFCDFTV